MKSPNETDYSDARRIFRDVEAFHGVMNFFPFAEDVPGGKDAVDKKRIRIMNEEGGELAEAIEQGNRAAILHEGVDKIYTVVGALVEAGITAEEFSVGWGLVHSANMSKDAPESPLDKAVKGDRFRRADCSLALGAQAEEHRYGITFGAGKNEGATFISTIGPMTKIDFQRACQHTVEGGGAMPKMIVELA